jgi:GrpB-like predicted nucleotidyltransferase (UPF0157 family)
MAETPGPEYLVPPERASRVVIVGPDAGWTEQYAAEEALVSAALGTVLRTVEHVGSTSVPELAAKPIIDVVLTVADPTDEAAYVGALESAGYTFHLREAHWHEHRLFKKGVPHFTVDRPAGRPAVNLHVFPGGCDEVRRMLAFRDHLREHEGDRRLYEQTKRALAERSWGRVQDYADAKSDVVAEILQRASQHSGGDGPPVTTCPACAG